MIISLGFQLEIQEEISLEIGVFCAAGISDSCVIGAADLVDVRLNSVMIYAV
jgi:hypothetical protein